MVTPQRMTAPVFGEFLHRLMPSHERPVFLGVDHHSTHQARMVQDFIEQTHGRLRLFHRPPSAVELNRDQWVGGRWRTTAGSSGDHRSSPVARPGSPFPAPAAAAAGHHP